MGWERLPSPCLEGVLDYLEAHDRLSFMDVCPNWHDVVCSPIAWRYLNITVTRGDHRAKLKTVLAFVGTGVRHLNLLWDLRSTEDFSIYYLKALISSQVRLSTLTLTNSSHSYKLVNRSRVLFLVAKLIKGGKVEEVRIEGAWMRGGEMCRILRACGQTLRSVHIPGACRTQAPSLPLILLDLPRLSHLVLDSTAVTGELLSALSRGAPGLKLLGIRARLQQFPQIPSSAWAALKTPHPNMTVSLEIYSMLRHDQLCSCLQPDIPLSSLTWCCEQLPGEAPVGDIIRRVMRTVAAHYTNCLEVLVIQTRNCSESLDDVILNMTKKCRRLQTLHFNGFIRNLKTISEVMRNDNQQKFTFIDVYPKYLTMVQRKCVENMLREHEVINPQPWLTLRIKDPVPLTAYY